MGTVLTLPEALHARKNPTIQTLVFTNGHFDLLHVGHLDYLEKARALGDSLFVGINGDSASQALKGSGRPFVPADERARLVAALFSEVVPVPPKWMVLAVPPSLRLPSAKTWPEAGLKVASPVKVARLMVMVTKPLALPWWLASPAEVALAV